MKFLHPLCELDGGPPPSPAGKRDRLRSTSRLSWRHREEQHHARNQIGATCCKSDRASMDRQDLCARCVPAELTHVTAVIERVVEEATCRGACRPRARPASGKFGVRRRVVSGSGMIHEVTEALVVLRQRFVDMYRCNRGVAGSNCDLVEV